MGLGIFRHRAAQRAQGPFAMAGFNLVLLIIAAVLALLGVGCFWWRTRVSREIELMASTPPSTAAQAAQATPGTLVKIIGTLRCQSPVTSEFSQQPCAYFKAEITREEVYYDRDSDGKERRNTRTITVHSNTQNAACAVADSSGMVGIDFQGAEVEAVKVLERTGNPNTGSGFMGVLSAIGSAGDRYIEYILAPDSPVYVLAEARSGGQRLAQQDVRHQPQVGGGAHQGPRLQHEMAAGGRDHPAGDRGWCVVRSLEGRPVTAARVAFQ
jgi:hypothetical protein